jgi:hypothetical protein
MLLRALLLEPIPIFCQNQLLSTIARCVTDICSVSVVNISHVFQLLETLQNRLSRENYRSATRRSYETGDPTVSIKVGTSIAEGSHYGIEKLHP